MRAMLRAIDRRIAKVFPRWMRQDGQGMTEYIIIVGLIALAAIVVVSLFGQQIKAQFAAMAKALTGQDATVSTTASTQAQTQANTRGKLNQYKS